MESYINVDNTISERQFDTSLIVFASIIWIVVIILVILSCVCWDRRRRGSLNTLSNQDTASLEDLLSKPSLADPVSGLCEAGPYSFRRSQCTSSWTRESGRDSLGSSCAYIDNDGHESFTGTALLTSNALNKWNSAVHSQGQTKSCHLHNNKDSTQTSPEHNVRVTMSGNNCQKKQISDQDQVNFSHLHNVQLFSSGRCSFSHEVGHFVYGSKVPRTSLPTTDEHSESCVTCSSHVSGGNCSSHVSGGNMQVAAKEDVEQNQTRLCRNINTDNETNKQEKTSVQEKCELRKAENSLKLKTCVCADWQGNKMAASDKDQQATSMRRCMSLSQAFDEDLQGVRRKTISLNLKIDVHFENERNCREQLASVVCSPSIDCHHVRATPANCYVYDNQKTKVSLGKFDTNTDIIYKHSTPSSLLHTNETSHTIDQAVKEKLLQHSFQLKSQQLNSHLKVNIHKRRSEPIIVINSFDKDCNSKQLNRLSVTLPYVLTTPDTLQHVLATSDTLPHVLTTETLPQVLTTSDTLPHVLTSDTLPHILTTSDSLPQVLTTSETVPQVLATSDTLPHVLATSDTLPQVVTTSDTLPQVLATSDTLPQVLTTSDILPHVLTTSNTLPHVLTTSNTLPHVLAMSEVQGLIKQNEEKSVASMRHHFCHSVPGHHMKGSKTPSNNSAPTEQNESTSGPLFNISADVSVGDCSLNKQSMSSVTSQRLFNNISQISLKEQPRRHEAIESSRGIDNTNQMTCCLMSTISELDICHDISKQGNDDMGQDITDKLNTRHRHDDLQLKYFNKMNTTSYYDNKNTKQSKVGCHSKKNITDTIALVNPATGPHTKTLVNPATGLQTTALVNPATGLHTTTLVNPATEPHTTTLVNPTTSPIITETQCPIDSSASDLKLTTENSHGLESSQYDCHKIALMRDGWANAQSLEVAEGEGNSCEVAVGQGNSCEVVVGQGHDCEVAVGQENSCEVVVGQGHDCEVAVGQRNSCEVVVGQGHDCEVAVGQGHCCKVVVRQGHSCEVVVGQGHGCEVAVGQGHGCEVAVGHGHGCEVAVGQGHGCEVVVGQGHGCEVVSVKDIEVVPSKLLEASIKVPIVDNKIEERAITAGKNHNRKVVVCTKENTSNMQTFTDSDNKTKPGRRAHVKETQDTDNSGHQIWIDKQVVPNLSPLKVHKTEEHMPDTTGTGQKRNDISKPATDKSSTVADFGQDEGSEESDYDNPWDDLDDAVKRASIRYNRRPSRIAAGDTKTLLLKSAEDLGRLLEEADKRRQNRQARNSYQLKSPDCSTNSMTIPFTKYSPHRHTVKGIVSQPLLSTSHSTEDILKTENSKYSQMNFSHKQDRPEKRILGIDSRRPMSLTSKVKAKVILADTTKNKK